MYELGLIAPLQLFTGQFLTWAIGFLVLALLAGLVGFRGVAGIAMEIAWLLVFVFIVLAVVAFVL